MIEQKFKLGQSVFVLRSKSIFGHRWFRIEERYFKIYERENIRDI